MKLSHRSEIFFIKIPRGVSSFQPLIKAQWQSIRSRVHKTRWHNIDLMSKCSSNYGHMIEKTIDLRGLCQLVVLIRPSREAIDNL